MRSKDFAHQWAVSIRASHRHHNISETQFRTAIASIPHSPRESYNHDVRWPALRDERPRDADNLRECTGPSWGLGQGSRGWPMIRELSYFQRKILVCTSVVSMTKQLSFKSYLRVHSPFTARHQWARQWARVYPRCTVYTNDSITYQLSSLPVFWRC